MMRIRNVAALVAAIGVLSLPRVAAAQTWWSPTIFEYSGVDLATTPYLSTNGSYTIGWGYPAGTAFPVMEYLMESVNGGAPTQVPISGASKSFTGRAPGVYTYQLYGVDFTRGWAVKSFPRSVRVVAPTGPVITFNPNQESPGLAFGMMTEGTQRTLTAYFRNIGKGDLIVSGCNALTDSEGGGDVFSCSFPRSLPFRLPAGSSQAVTVRAAVYGYAVWSGSVQIQSNAINPQDGVLSLGAESVPAAGPRIAVDTALVDFGNVPVGTTVTRTVTVRNVGTAAPYYGVTGLTVNGCPIETYTEDSRYQTTYTCSFSTPWPVLIAPGSSAALTISFTPRNTYGTYALVKPSSDAFNDQADGWITVQGKGL